MGREQRWATLLSGAARMIRKTRLCPDLLPQARIYAASISSGMFAMKARRAPLIRRRTWLNSRTAIEQIGDVRLVIIDPIAMVATKDSHRNAETRRDLQPVADLCRTTGAAVLGIHHLAKGTGGREPQERLIGSIAFAAMPRVVMIAMKLPPEDQGASERRVLDAGQVQHWT